MIHAAEDTFTLGEPALNIRGQLVPFTVTLVAYVLKVVACTIAVHE